MKCRYDVTLYGQNEYAGSWHVFMLMARQQSAKLMAAHCLKELQNRMIPFRGVCEVGTVFHDGRREW